MREAEMADLKKTFDEVKDTAAGFTGNNVMTSLQKDVTDSLRIDDIDKPSAIEPSVTANADAPATPTTPEPPTPQTFVEAEAHVAAEPLAITREVQAEPAPQDITPTPPDVLKDAKAS
jgi:sec-independent protein translocase protein TatB